ncbi:hypothetical protein [Paraburkholderia sp. HD33-4]|uniref:hypothetical protein n=1 Tax=Paraburkholderia sp. HD33-4 TaxID=2883242 RepID=UPI001F458CBB|nr:hypothetical protein [Paraburkholderia sp. HD33-4]
MTSRSVLAAAESAVLERMAVSRANLVTARVTAHLQQTGGKPTVTLLAALLVGSLVMGPRKIVGVVVRNAFVAWIAKTVRRIAGT